MLGRFRDHNVHQYKLNEGKTALDIARSRDHNQVVQLLEAELSRREVKKIHRREEEEIDTFDENYNEDDDRSIALA